MSVNPSQMVCRVSIRSSSLLAGFQWAGSVGFVLTLTLIVAYLARIFKRFVLQL